MRLLHYSIHTERTYCDWIKRYVLFHEMKSQEEFAYPEKKIEAFLSFKKNLMKKIKQLCSKSRLHGQFNIKLCKVV